MEENKKCPKCGDDMIKGLMKTIGPKVGETMWVEKLGFFKSENPRHTVTYRCKKCGYLESYSE